MFNLNIPPSSLLGFEGSSLCSTPKTPEIVNSLIAMSNPMDSYNFSTAALTPGNAVSVRNFTTVSSAQSTSQDSSHSSCSASPLDSPAGIHTTPSVQQTCSQLIKAGLKLSIQSKRKLSTCDSSSGSEQPQSKCSRRDEEYDESTDDDSENKSAPKGLTPEDEDRRRRRRERNKIAATKCRMKKRERTQNLMKESEQLDTQNVDLKNQARTLETERRRLLEMLQSHASTCVNQAVFSIPSKLLHSPATKYLAELELELNNSAASMNDDMAAAGTPTNGPQLQQELHKSGNGNSCSKLPPLPPRTVIPPVSTIKFSRSNGMKAVTAVSNASSPMCNVNMAQQVHQLPTHQQLPNGYCKPSPTPQDLGYLNSPAQENICLPSLQPHHGAQTPTTHQAAPAVNHQLADYFPNCDSAMSMRITHASTPTPSSGGDNTVLLGGVVSPLSAVSTPTTTEFVKNELVDSQSPYTTAQSAERFLFENNCDSFVDIKHAVSVLPGSHSNNSMNSLTNHNNNNLLDFHSSLIGSSAGSIVPFHDHISMKNDFLHDTDLLGQLTGDASEFVDLDTGVTSAFMTNGGCLA